MRSLLAFFLIGFIEFNCAAQQRPSVVQGKTYDDTSINQYVGEWISTDKSTVLKISLKKEIVEHPGGIKIGSLIGFHSLEKDHKLINSSYEKKSSKAADASTIVLNASSKSNLLRGTIREDSSDEIYRITLLYDPAEGTLTGNISDLGGIKVNRKSHKSTLPARFVLIRVK